MFSCFSQQLYIFLFTITHAWQKNCDFLNFVNISNFSKSVMSSDVMLHLFSEKRHSSLWLKVTIYPLKKVFFPIWTRDLENFAALTATCKQCTVQKALFTYSYQKTRECISYYSLRNIIYCLL